MDYEANDDGRDGTGRHTAVLPCSGLGGPITGETAGDHHLGSPCYTMMAPQFLGATDLSEHAQRALPPDREPARNTTLTPRHPPVIHWNIGDNSRVNAPSIDNTQTREDTHNGASAQAGQLPAGAERHPGCVSNNHQHHGNTGGSASSAGTTAFVGGPAGAGHSAGQRSLALICGMANRAMNPRAEHRQHIEDLIADALYDHELGTTSHRRQAEAVLAALIAHGVMGGV